MHAVRQFVVVVGFPVWVSAQTLLWPGEPIATIDAANLRAYVPAAAAERLRGLVARADRIYAHMQADAGFVPADKLRLLVADWFDDHNGYSFVSPFPLVQVELAPAMPESTIFSGGGDVERTLIHEFAHQLANDRNHGFRSVLEQIFGRVLPNDPASLLLWYFATPAHQTMPRFWQEGLAVWAETSYADPAGVWAGRGRDAFTHMVWRLDAAAGGIPAAADWRITWHEWPFGGRAYTYGTAYTRWLEGRFGERASVWRLVQDQARTWPFVFDRGPRRLLGLRHAAMLQDARAALQQEQERILATLRGVPLTPLVRRTPKDMLVGAPAWRADGSLVFAGKSAQGRARQHTLAADGTLRGSSTPTLALSPMRSLADGQDTGVVHDEFNWRGIRRVGVDGAVVGWRLSQPDAGPLQAGERTLVAIQLQDGGGQQLVLHRLRAGEPDAGVVVATEGVPWTPTLRPGHDELAWVETDANGSRLVLASRRDPTARRLLLSVRARILHPVWSADGQHLFCCSDVSGVANAYRIAVAGDAATVIPVTHTLGGVIACVPSPDGRRLAIVDHDADGPFLATMPNDPAAFARAVPKIDLAWPAPVDGEPARADARRPTPIPATPAAAGEALTVAPYRGLAELRPLFWAPTTLAVPEGGYGAFGMLADPLFTHVVQAGAGVGYVEQEPVGFLGYDYLGSVVELGVRGGRSERTFAQTVIRGADELDYTETVAHGELRAGRGLFALERTWLAYAALGIEDHDEVDDAAVANAGGVPLKAPFRDTERYAEFTLGYADSTAYPTSYTFEDGLSVVGSYRLSGLGGELERNRALGDAGYTWSLFPEAGHQLVVRGQLGWSDGDDTLQGNFSVGGGLSTGLPRGYLDAAVATGRHLLAASLAYRFPVWRPFAAAGTAPFRARQVVVELFGDTAKVSDDRLGGDGEWLSSVGAEVFFDAEFFDAGLAPGIGVAFQLDGEQDVRVWFALGIGF